MLIDSVVRQVTVLIAQLATSGGVRAPMAHIANQVFVELSRELQAQGVSRKVSADMFGMALRAYQRKLKRLTSEAGGREQTLWRAVHDALAESGPLTREQVFLRFHGDEEAVVRGVLHDLVESELVATSGQGLETRYWAVSEIELQKRLPGKDDPGFESLLWALVYRLGPIRAASLAEQVGLAPAMVIGCLQKLASNGRLQENAGCYEAFDFSVPLNAAVGWEAAVFDHVQAMVQTICQRLRLGGSVPAGSESVGGSTYTFDIWEGHPLEDEVQGSLARFRAAHSQLRQRVETWNAAHGRPQRYTQVVLYGGQSAIEREQGTGEQKEDGVNDE